MIDVSVLLYMCFLIEALETNHFKHRIYTYTMVTGNTLSNKYNYHLYFQKKPEYRYNFVVSIIQLCLILDLKDAFTCMPMYYYAKA